MSTAKKFIVAWFVVFLHYVPQITLWQSENERYTAWWGQDNLLRILAGSLLVAGVAVAVDALLGRYGPVWLKRLFNHSFLLALASGLLAAFPAFADKHPAWVDGLWLAAILVIIASLLWPRSALVRYAAIFCLVFSPLIPVLFVQMLTWPTWSEPPAPLPADAEEATSGTPVIVVVFDEWSWLRSTRDGQLPPCFKNVRELAGHSVVFQNALSPYRETMQSLPRIIFQTDREFVVRDGTASLDGNGKSVSTAEAGSLFTTAREHGYTTGLLGWFHPYRRVLGGTVDYCRTYFAGDEMGTAGRTADELLENGRNWTDSLSRRFLPPLLDRMDAQNAYRMGVRYREDMLKAISGCRGRSFMFFHVPSPHAPNVFDADGSYHGPDNDWSDSAGYMRQLQYVDTLVGQIVAALRENGTFDDAMLVLTSDHGWRFDPDDDFKQVPDWDRRVPLVIKLPGQRQGSVIGESFCTNRLMPLFEAVFSGKASRQGLLRLVREMAASREGR